MLPMSLDVSRRLTGRISRSAILRYRETAELIHLDPVAGIVCFIDELHITREFRRNEIKVTADWVVLFLPDQSIVVGDLLLDGLDTASSLDSGIVVRIEDSEHPADGKKLRTVYVSKHPREQAVSTALYTWIQTDPMWASTSPLWADYTGAP